jgi:tRNA threonylcarbamoyladenosine biosynthesis protein TsaB
MDQLLKKERMTLAEVDAFAIDRGPGSFTGLRIGFSLLKGFLSVRKRPCYGALSLDMISHRIAFPEGSRLGVVVDARRESIYSRFYQRRKGEWKAERKLELLSFPELTRAITVGTTLVGDALIRYQGPLTEAFGKGLRFLEEDEASPSARTLVEWFQAVDPRLSRLEKAQELVPLYFRASEAEEKRKKAKTR